MKTELKESLQFIMQHPAIGSPLVQHAQNLARHVTSQHYEAMTANEEYPSGSDNGLQWFRDLSASPQVTDEQIERAAQIIAASFDYPWKEMPEEGKNNMRDIARKVLSAPPAAETHVSGLREGDIGELIAAAQCLAKHAHWEDQAYSKIVAEIAQRLNKVPPVAETPDPLLRAMIDDGIVTAPQEAKPVAADGTRYFRKKPVVIQAVQWTGENLHEVISFTDGPPDIRSMHAGMKWDEYGDLVKRDGLKIYTLEGKMNADVGDWIIKGVKGEHYPCKPDVFELTYERAAAPQEQAPADKDAIRDFAFEQAAYAAQYNGSATDNQSDDYHRGYMRGRMAAAVSIRALQSQPQQVTK